ncbi:MAG: hypothetical protein ACYSTY_02855 [Planctomycetota bacterium]
MAGTQGNRLSGRALSASGRPRRRPADYVRALVTRSRNHEALAVQAEVGEVH